MSAVETKPELLTLAVTRINSAIKSANLEAVLLGAIHERERAKGYAQGLYRALSIIQDLTNEGNEGKGHYGQ